MPTSTITAAYSSGTMVRGIETILLGRDPRDAWAFAQRSCGVCTTVHAIRLDPLGRGRPRHPDPEGGQHHPEHDDRPAVRPRPRHALLSSPRPGLGGYRQLRSKRTRRRPRRSSRPSLPGRTPPRPISRRSKKKVEGIVESGQLSIFSNGYWGHPAYKLPPEINLLAVAHYLECTRLAVAGHQDPHDLRREEPASELRRRRRSHAHRS